MTPSLWTGLVPAAGRGSRLEFDQPKVLFPVAGRPILEWLLDFLMPTCSRVVLVLSPSGRQVVEDYLAGHHPAEYAAGRFRIALQEVPRGMGDAVEVGLQAVETPHVAIVWGDQVALRRSSVEACLSEHESSPAQPALTFPTLWRERPYIHFGRDSEGRIDSLLQAREGDKMPERGESDTGFFCGRAETVRSLLTELRQAPAMKGSATEEFNFLPVIPLAARQGRTILTPSVVTLEETMGVNSREDAAWLESYLNKSSVGSTT